MARVVGTAFASPTESTPVTSGNTGRSPAVTVPYSTTPVSRPSSLIAFSGHSKEHAPQEWQSSGNTKTVEPMTVMA